MDYEEKTEYLTFAERATFGTCSICGAGPGQWCSPDAGLLIGVKVNGGPPSPGDGAHLARLAASPRLRVIRYRR